VSINAKHFIELLATANSAKSLQNIRFLIDTPFIIYHLPGNLLSGIVSFLTDRLQCTKVNGISSALGCINRSIVQGSAIGPNTFAIYVTDLKALGVTNTLIKYADDTTLLVPKICDVSIEDELENIIQWSRANNLQLNLLKTKEIVFRRPTVHQDILPVKLCDI